MAETRTNSFGRPVLYALVALGVYLSYRILGPFIVALTWAIMLAVLCYGMQAALARKIDAGRAALVMTVVVGLGLVTPAVAVITILAREAPQVADHFKQASPGVSPTIQRIWETARMRIPAPIPEDPTAVIGPIILVTTARLLEDLHHPDLLQPSEPPVIMTSPHEVTEDRGRMS